MDNEMRDINLISEIEKALFEAVTRHQSDIEAEKQWLLTNCEKTNLSIIISDLTVTAFHVLDAIGRFQPINSINITKNSNIPKGTVSKNIKKLVSKNLITKSPLPDNKKEAVIKLTPLGEELFELYKKLHRKFNLEFSDFLKRYSAEELKFLIQFLKDFQNLTWISR